jgi:hypothetical protein
MANFCSIIIYNSVRKWLMKMKQTQSERTPYVTTN